MTMAVKVGASPWIEVTPKITVKTYIMITVVLKAMMQNMELVRNIMSEGPMMQQLVSESIIIESSTTHELVRRSILMKEWTKAVESAYVSRRGPSSELHGCGPFA